MWSEGERERESERKNKIQSEELWPTQNPQFPALLILLFFSLSLSLSLFPSLPRSLSLPLLSFSFASSPFFSCSFYFFLSRSPTLFLSSFLHGVQKWRAIWLLLERSRFQLPPLRAATPRATFLVLLLFSSKTFQNWNQMLSPLDAVDARWRSSAPMSVISKVGRPSMVCARGLAPRGKGFMSCSSTVSRAID